jgi:hypothetical protein
MLTMLPLRCRSMIGVTNLAILTTLRSKRSMPRCQSASEMESRSALGGWPVLLTTASIRPKVLIVESTTSRSTSASVTDPVWAIATSGPS